MNNPPLLHDDPAYRAAVDVVLDAARRVRDARIQIADTLRQHHEGRLNRSAYRKVVLTVTSIRQEEEVRLDAALKAVEEATADFNRRTARNPAYDVRWTVCPPRLGYD